MEVNINLYQFMALAPVVYYLGSFVTKKVKFLEKYCIPAPVVGGLIAVVIKLFLHLGGIDLVMDNTVQGVFMYVFFASIGYNCRFKMLKKGGKSLVIMTILTGILILTQNGIGIVMAKVFGMDWRLGFCMGSIPMVGGHGTVGNWGMVLDNMGVKNAFMVGIACASYGLIAGGLMGGPVAKALISRHHLSYPGAKNEEVVVDHEGNKDIVHPLNKKKMYLAAFLLILTVGMGDVLLKIIAALHIPFRAMSIGTLVIGMIIRNVCDSKKVELPDDELGVVGGFALSGYLSLAMLSVNLWELADLALPMIVVMIIQTIIMFLFTYFIVFRACGKDYDAAVIASGTCGFGMGAAFTGIANMEALRTEFGEAPRAFLVVPLLGAFLVDLINTTLFTIVTGII